MTSAIKISGRSGRHQLINDTYEPLQITHNKHPAWVARSATRRYIFHSGKNRWVISALLDDGARCWSFLQAGENSVSPIDCQGPWTCCDQDGEWRQDSAVTCQAVAPSNDKFVQLRLSLDAEMKQYKLIDISSLKQLWRRLDYNNNGIVSLAEIDKMAVELVSGGTWPSWLNNKPALMRAYQKTTLKDGDGDSWVEKKEFHALLLNIFWFSKLWQVFDAVDTGNDRRIDMREFVGGLSRLGLQLSEQEAVQEFNKIDSNRGGQVLFVEFCAYVRQRVNPDHQAEFDADIVSGEHATRTIRQHTSHKNANDLHLKKKCFRDFDDLEQKIKVMLQDDSQVRKLWDHLDYNGNEIVSLAEIDKFAVEQYPLLNHKPALMRAYKASISGRGHDDWVHKKEFKALMANLFYFNKLYWIFDQVDGDDRRVTFQEFKYCLSLCGCPMTDGDARREFSSADRNGGGMILFDEFCALFASKNCPHAMMELVG